MHFTQGFSTESGKSEDFVFNQGKSEERERFFRKIRENQGTYKVLVLFQSGDFLHNKSCIQLSVIVANLYPFVYYSVVFSHYGAQFLFL